MTPGSSHRGPSRWPLIAAITVPPILVGGLVVVSTLTASTSPHPDDLWVGATEYGPASTAPAADVQAAHEALHDIGAQCLRAEPDSSSIAADVDVIVGFTQRYPLGRFPIDDETATAASLLIVTRDAVKNCAPQHLEQIDVELERLAQD